MSIQKKRMEENTHISYFKVENFKRFESFEMENIGQFNLIVGDNNVGKTTVLEALLFDTNISKFFFHMLSALGFRSIDIYDNISEIFNFFLRQSDNLNQISYSFKETNGTRINNLSFQVLNKNSLSEKEIISLQKKILINPDKHELIKSNYNGHEDSDFPASIDSDGYTPFVGVNLGYREDLVDFYSENIQPSSNRKRNLIEDLKLFIPEIWDLEISSAVVEDENFIIARHISFDKPLPITMFGEGSVKLLRILLEINMCENGRLMIDEIDTGIYHGRFKKFWKIILLAARRNNVQLFATTHSQECLKFIKEVLEEDEELKDFQKDMRCFRLVEQKDKSVKSYCYDYEKFQFAIDHENEIR